MSDYTVFVSVGATATEKQEAFVRAVEERLRSEGIDPRTVGRNTFSADSPLKTVKDLMGRCHGTIVLALERTYFPIGLERRGGPNEAHLSEVRYPTPWNQIEAGMAFTRGLPLMVIVEKGLQNEGLLEPGFEWYVQSIEPTASALNTPEFNGVLSSWKQKVIERASATISGETKNDGDLLEQLTVGNLISRMKPSHLWSVLLALATLVGGAFALGGRFLAVGNEPQVPKTVKAEMNNLPTAKSTWTDPQTGLTWTAEDNGKNVDWNEATNYCSNLNKQNFGGYSAGWSLPTIEQLEALYDRSITRTYFYHGPPYGGMEDGGAYKNHIKQIELNSCCAWSNTRDGNSNAYYYRFHLGERHSYEIDGVGLVRAFCVHNP